jgi:hypothetical protein
MSLLLAEDGFLDAQSSLVFWTILTALLFAFVLIRAMGRVRAEPLVEGKQAVEHPPAGRDTRSEAEKRLAEHQDAVAAYRREAFGPPPKDVKATARPRADLAKKT